MTRFLCICLLLTLHTAARSAEEPTPYQQDVQRVRESLYGSRTDVSEAEPPKLDPATRFRMLGELRDLDPYWRLEEQITDDLVALEKHSSKDEELSRTAVAYAEIRTVLGWLRRIPPTKEQAESEVAEIRIFLLRRDIDGALQFMRSKL